MKYVGIWWKCTLEINLGFRRFSKRANSLTQDLICQKHGVTTENTKRYIDSFAAKNGFGVLVEG
jgi:hypothetical protein